MTKINKDDGTEVWMKRFGSKSCVFDTIDSIVEDNDKNLVAIGKYEIPCPKYNCHHGYACGDMYFLKINPNNGNTPSLGFISISISLMFAANLRKKK